MELSKFFRTLVIILIVNIAFRVKFGKFLYLVFIKCVNFTGCRHF